MKITNVFGAILIFAATASTSFGGYYYDGNDILERCQADNAICTGYIAGLVDQHEVTSAVKKYFCIPSNVTLQQLIDISIKYYEEHPEGRHYVASSTITVALAQAFPC